jgi:hypothetical protein
MSKKLDAMLSEVSSLVASATAVSAKKTLARTVVHVVATDYETNGEAQAFVDWLNDLDIDGLTAEVSDNYRDASDDDVSQELWLAYSEQDADAARAVMGMKPTSASTVSAKKKPQHAVEKDSKGKFRIRSMKDGKLWPQTYDTKEKANKGLAAYHLRKKGVPPKKTKAAAECPECGAEAKIDMRGMHCPECGYNDHDAEAMSASAKKVKAAEPSMSYDPRDKMYLRKLKKIVDRGYMEAEEVGGAVFEALHKAKVSNRMAGAIAQKVQEALFDAEEDVIDVSAKAKLAAKAKLEATRRK